MPYSGADDAGLPSNVKKMGAGARKRWVAIWNAAFKECQAKGGKDCESIAFRIANGKLKGSEEEESEGVAICAAKEITVAVAQLLSHSHRRRAEVVLEMTLDGFGNLTVAVRDIEMKDEQKERGGLDIR